jgi:hypothetical protein
MKTLFRMFAVLSLLVMSAVAQIPTPYVYAGGIINGSGYSTVASLAGVGLSSESNHFSWRAEADYDNAKKVDDGVNGISGHNTGRDRGLRTSVYYRFSNGWMFGPGARWSELSTTGYQKQSWHGTMGVGKDFIRDNYSFRLTADVLVPRIGSEHVNQQGCTIPKGQCTSGPQGVDVHYVLPSPALHGHFFFMVDAGVYVVHTTVTSTDPKLTALQIAAKQTTGSTSFTLLVRF